jgi:NADH:ubiquinone oxidoreductase subunit 4 (subunit M)
MLGMIQRVFYGPQSQLVTRNAARDFGAREHILLWPMAVLMLAMGIASPFWMRAIDQGVSHLSNDSKHSDLTGAQVVFRISSSFGSAPAVIPSEAQGEKR